MGQPAQPLIEALEQRGHRLTGARRRVAGLIGQRHGHFTAAELIDDARLTRPAVGRATVFRSLDLFTDLGALERLDLPSGDHAYVACEPVHHHHVVCSRCGRTAEVADLGLQSVVGEAARQTGYQIEKHRLELYGLCPECRQ